MCWRTCFGCCVNWQRFRSVHIVVIHLYCGVRAREEEKKREKRNESLEFEHISLLEFLFSFSMQFKFTSESSFRFLFILFLFLCTWAMTTFCEPFVWIRCRIEFKEMVDDCCSTVFCKVVFVLYLIQILGTDGLIATNLITASFGSTNFSSEWKYTLKNMGHCSQHVLFCFDFIIIY